MVYTIDNTTIVWILILFYLKTSLTKETKSHHNWIKTLKIHQILQIQPQNLIQKIRVLIQFSTTALSIQNTNQTRNLIPLRITISMTPKFIIKIIILMKMFKTHKLWKKCKKIRIIIYLIESISKIKWTWRRFKEMSGHIEWVTYQQLRNSMEKVWENTCTRKRVKGKEIMRSWCKIKDLSCSNNNQFQEWRNRLTPCQQVKTKSLIKIYSIPKESLQITRRNYSNSDWNRIGILWQSIILWQISIMKTVGKIRCRILKIKTKSGTDGWAEYLKILRNKVKSTKSGTIN